tara:strand:- start:161 stop:352 length:192 start_codon:yes stop_codon:yes gene_type:complete
VRSGKRHEAAVKRDHGMAHRHICRKVQCEHRFAYQLLKVGLICVVATDPSELRSLVVSEKHCC